MGRKLTDRERLFVAYYLGQTKGNATQSARLAGYNNPAQTGSRLVAKAHISSAIEAKLAKVEMTQEEVLLRLTNLARADMGNFIRFPSLEGPPVLDLMKAKRRNQLVCVKKLKSSRIDRGDDQDPLEIVEVELNSPIQALTVLAKYHGIVDRAAEQVQVEQDKPRINIPGSDVRSKPINAG